MSGWAAPTARVRIRNFRPGDVQDDVDPNGLEFADQGRLAHERSASVLMNVAPTLSKPNWVGPIMPSVLGSQGACSDTI